MTLPTDLNALSPEQLRALAAQVIAQVQGRDREIEEKTREVDENARELHYRQTRIEQLSHEISILKRQQYGRRSEQFSSEQMSLLDESADADLAAIELELEQLQPETTADQSRQPPKRASLPAQLARTEIHHEPDTTVCPCGCERVCIGEDISEKLDYTSGVFTVERHIRGKWVCRNCETLIQAPVPAHVIDKGIPTTGLLFASQNFFFDAGGSNVVFYCWRRPPLHPTIYGYDAPHSFGGGRMQSLAASYSACDHHQISRESHDSPSSPNTRLGLWTPSFSLNDPTAVLFLARDRRLRADLSQPRGNAGLAQARALRTRAAGRRYLPLECLSTTAKAC